MSTKSKKGSAFERKLSKFLSSWVQGSENPLLFWRQILSGGMMKIKKQTDETLSGDIHAIHPNGEFLTNYFSIELKAGYKDASFDKHTEDLTSDKIQQFWIQACTDAEKAHKTPILIFNKLRSMTVIGVTEKVYKYFKEQLKDLRLVHLSWGLKNNLPDVYFIDMESFFKVITPKDIQLLIESEKKSNVQLNSSP